MPVPTVTQVAHAERPMLRDTVAQAIRAAIMDGTFAPGERLHDEQLQTWLGVSRTPVRDALNELRRTGLIEMAANRYTRVTAPDGTDAVEAAHALGVLIGGVVRLAVPRLDASTRAAIANDIDRTLVHLTPAEGSDVDAERLSIATLHLYNQYVEQCGNQLLIRVCNDSLDGLAYRLRIGRLSTILDFPTMRDAYAALREATLTGDALAAQLATESLHQLPGAREHV